MRAIIVSDVEMKALMERLELTALREAGHYRGVVDPQSEAIKEAHRIFHYQVVRWIQEVGGKVT